VSRGLQHSPLGVGQLQGRRVSPARGSSGGSTRLPVQISSRGIVCHQLRAAPGPTHVPWAPALASRRRTAPGMPCVPAAPGQRKNVGPNSSETKLRTIFLACAARCRAAPGAPCVPTAPGQMKTIEPIQKTLPSQASVRQHQSDRSGTKHRGRRSTATESIPIQSAADRL
jgi:hypothetical protein